MADITINDLTGHAPVSTDVFPFSTTGVTPSTYKATLAQVKTALSFATIATTGSYNDLIDKPSVQSVAQVIFNSDSATTSINDSTNYLPTNITVSAGSKVLIQARITMSGSGANYFNVALRRSNVANNNAIIDNAINDSYGYTENITFAVLDNPGAGTHTYQFYNQSGGPRSINRNSGNNYSCYSTILLQEIKNVQLI
jgi:hypothetical protein